MGAGPIRRDARDALRPRPASPGDRVQERTRLSVCERACGGVRESLKGRFKRQILYKVYPQQLSVLAPAPCPALEENGLAVRVLIITGEFPPRQGGVGDYTYAIARGFAAQEAQVQVLTSQPADGDPPDPIDGTAFSITRAISKWNWSSLRTIAQCIQEFAPDIADIQY